MVDQNVHKAIFKLALPASGTMLLVSLFNLIDIFWVGKLGALAIAGVSGSTFVIWSIYSITDITSDGINALIAQYVGANNLEKANTVGILGIIVGAVFALVVIAVLMPMQHVYFTFMKLEGQVFIYASEYFTWFLAGIIAVFTWKNIDAIFRGSGDTATPLILFSLALILNIVLDPLLIFGIWVFPELGVGGSAVATVIAQFLSCLVGFMILKKRGWKIGIRFGEMASLFQTESKVVKNIIRIGLPVGLTGFIFSLVYIALVPLLSTLGSAPLAALGVGHRLESIAYFICVGFSIAAATLVGQNVGAEQFEQAEKSAWLTAGYLSLMLLPICLVFIIFPEQIVSFFVKDEAVIQHGSYYIRIIGCFEIFMGIEVIMEQAFSGAGNTLPAMLISVPLTVLRVPAAYLFGIVLGYGTVGIWFSIAVSTFLKAITLSFWFNKGRWKNINSISPVPTPQVIQHYD